MGRFPAYPGEFLRYSQIFTCFSVPFASIHSFDGHLFFFALRFRLLQGMLDALAGAKRSMNSHQTWECLFFTPGKTDMTKWKISLFLIGDAS